MSDHVSLRALNVSTEECDTIDDILQRNDILLTYSSSWIFLIDD